MKTSEKRATEARRLLRRPDFQQDVLTIRKYLGIEDDGLQTQDDRTHWEQDFIENKNRRFSEIDDNVAVLLKKYQLTHGWHHSIKRYVIMNNPEDMQLPTEISVGTVRRDKSQRSDIVMYIPPDATKREINAALVEVTRLQKRVLGKTRRPRVAETESMGKLIHDLISDGYQIQDITMLIDGQLDDAITTNDVYDLLKTYKNLPGLK